MKIVRHNYFLFSQRCLMNNKVFADNIHMCAELEYDLQRENLFRTFIRSIFRLFPILTGSKQEIHFTSGVMKSLRLSNSRET